MHTTTLLTLFLAALSPAVLASHAEHQHGSYTKSKFPLYPTGASTGGFLPTGTGGIYPTGTAPFTLPTGGFPTGFLTHTRKHGGPKTKA